MATEKNSLTEIGNKCNPRGVILRESPIFVKTYDLLLWIQNHTGHYPKHERFRLAKRIEDTAFEFYDQILRAALVEEKAHELKEGELLLKKLTTLCRIAKDSNYMTPNQYLFVSEKLVELARLIHAWKKRENQPRSEEHTSELQSPNTK